MANQVAYGFLDLKALMAERVVGTTVDIVSRAIQESVDEHNRQMAALTDLFVFPTEQFKVRFQSASISRLQPLDENGRALPITTGGYWEIALPIQEAGTAWGANWLTRQKMTVADAARVTAMMLEADFRWMRDHILAALYTNISWAFTDVQHGALTIMPLANADTQQYLLRSGQDSAATDTHFLAQAAAIADGANPFPTIRDELMEHPENAGSVVALVPTNLIAAVEALATFKERTDPNIAPGTSTDRLVGNLGIAVPGELRGYETSGVWIVEWASLPDNYIIATTTGGDRPLAMRQHPEAELRGFIPVAEREDHPFWERQYIRMAGFGAWNRVGAVVYRVGNASYAVPTGYAAPLI